MIKKRSIALAILAAVIAPLTCFAQGNLKGEPVVLTIYEDATYSGSDVNKNMMAALKEATNIDLQIKLLPGAAADIFPKMEINLIAGDTVDLVRLTNVIVQSKFVKAGWIMPLDDLAKKNNFDMKKTFGNTLVTNSDGKVRYLPYQLADQMVFYNKKIFDDAKVAYPKDGWTWDDYIATAKKLTDAKKGIYGSLMQNWTYFMYSAAQQRGVPDYKADGSSNLTIRPSRTPCNGLAIWATNTRSSPAGWNSASRSLTGTPSWPASMA